MCSCLKPWPLTQAGWGREGRYSVAVLNTTTCILGVLFLPNTVLQIKSSHEGLLFGHWQGSWGLWRVRLPRCKPRLGWVQCISTLSLLTPSFFLLQSLSAATGNVFPSVQGNTLLVKCWSQAKGSLENKFTEDWFSYYWRQPWNLYGSFCCLRKSLPRASFLPWVPFAGCWETNFRDHYWYLGYTAGILLMYRVVHTFP